MTCRRLPGDPSAPSSQTCQRPFGPGIENSILPASKCTIDVADELVLRRLVQRADAALRADRTQDGDLIVVSVAGQRAIALPVLRQSQLVRFAADQQQAVETQQRMIQQRFAPQLAGISHQVGCRLRGSAIAVGQSQFHLTRPPLQVIEPLQVLRAANVPRRERAVQILHRPPQRGQIDRS